MVQRCSRCPSCRGPTTPPTRSPSRSATPTARRSRARRWRPRMIALVRGEVAVAPRRPRRRGRAAASATALAVSAETLSHVRAVGRQVTLHTHLIVRDDALQLYGFATEEERDLFLLLLGVQSVGPKVALAVLSGGPPRELLGASPAGDAARFQAVPGIGKRTAERIIVELREKVGVDAAGRRDRRSRAPTTRGRSRARAWSGSASRPQEAEALLDGAAGETPEELIAHALQGGAPMTARPEPTGIQTPDVLPPRTSSTARCARAARGLRRPGGGQRAARRLDRGGARRAARRSTTCCSPARPASARPRWRRSSPPSSTCRSCRRPARRWSARATSPRS